MPSPPSTPSSASASSSSRARRSAGLRVAVLGATGLVGKEMLRLLEERAFPVAELRPLASPRSGSREVAFGGERIAVQPVSRAAFEGVDLVLASAGGSVSREWLPRAAAGGAVCIDNTSAFRMEPDVPLVVPEVNADQLDRIEFGGAGAIVANPNCSTIQLVVVLEPLRRAFGLERVQVSTYQSVSGAGRRALEQFRSASAAHLATADPANLGAHDEAGVPCFDVLPRIGELDEDGHTIEENKLMRETPKILGQDVAVDVTCARVPVFVGHGEAVVLQTREPAPVSAARDVLREAPGVRVHAHPFPPSPAAAAGTHEVHVGRLRASRTFEPGLQLWIAADNLLKGAAWNAVQIAESLVERGAARKGRVASGASRSTSSSPERTVAPRTHLST